MTITLAKLEIENKILTDSNQFNIKPEKQLQIIEAKYNQKLKELLKFKLYEISYHYYSKSFMPFNIINHMLSSISCGLCTYLLTNSLLLTVIFTLGYIIFSTAIIGWHNKNRIKIQQNQFLSEFAQQHNLDLADLIKLSPMKEEINVVNFIYGYHLNDNLILNNSKLNKANLSKLNQTYKQLYNEFLYIYSLKQLTEINYSDEYLNKLYKINSLLNIKVSNCSQLPEYHILQKFQNEFEENLVGEIYNYLINDLLNNCKVISIEPFLSDVIKQEIDDLLNKLENDTSSNIHGVVTMMHILQCINLDFTWFLKYNYSVVLDIENMNMGGQLQLSFPYLKPHLDKQFLIPKNKIETINNEINQINQLILEYPTIKHIVLEILNDFQSCNKNAMNNFKLLMDCFDKCKSLKKQ